jgi:hypothetical protein
MASNLLIPLPLGSPFFQVVPLNDGIFAEFMLYPQ